MIRASCRTAHCTTATSSPWANSPATRRYLYGTANMKPNKHDIEWKEDSVTFSTWENEGGALEVDSMDHHYGRRIETDRTWTIHHINSGVSACGLARN